MRISSCTSVLFDNVVFRVIKDYFLNSTLHGLRFIAEDNRHITERLFWAVCCLLSWYASYVLMHSSWTEFQNNAISFALETTYLEFQTNFPMVAVCEISNIDRTFQNAPRAASLAKNFSNAELFKDLSYLRIRGNFIKDYCFKNGVLNPEINCPVKNLSLIARALRSPCEEVLENCKWNGVPFSCCDQFLPLQTEMGVCFAINSAHTKRDGISAPPLDLRVNSSTGPGSLYMEFLTSAEVYLLSRYQVPNMNTNDDFFVTMQRSMLRYRAFTVHEVYNEPEVHDLSIGQRRCRFPEENFLDVYDTYSYTGCIVQCRKDAMMRLCNCTTHHTPNVRPEEECDLKSLLCIGAQERYLTVLESRWSDRSALYCPCPVSCEDQVVSNTYGILLHNYSMGTKSTLLLEQQSVPAERFKRYVVRGPLDMVVSMGGATGLFVGASLLSFVEVVYYFTARAYASLVLRRRPKQEQDKQKQNETPLLPLRRRRTVDKPQPPSCSVS